MEFNSEYFSLSVFSDLNKEAIVFPLISQAQQCQGFSFLVVGTKFISSLGFL
jgi:hypothetical protein